MTSSPITPSPYKHLIHLNQDYSPMPKKFPHWCQAMSEEFDILLRNSTWTLIPPHPTQNIIGYKWIFWVRRNPNGSLAWYKARLIAKGFNKCLGIDFHDTFKLVVKPTTIWVTFTVVVIKGWHSHQLDINNVFLQGIIWKKQKIKNNNIIPLSISLSLELKVKPKIKKLP